MNRPLQPLLFNSTHCLSKRQLRDYASGLLSREEAYAVESHLNTCPLCSAAVDGMIAHLPESTTVLAEVNGEFLKEHFRKNSPQIHLNTLAPAAAAPARPARTQPLWRMAGIAAALLIAAGSYWWIQGQHGSGSDGAVASADGPIAQATPPAGKIQNEPDEAEKMFSADAAAEPSGEEKLARADLRAGGPEPMASAPLSNAAPVEQSRQAPTARPSGAAAAPARAQVPPAPPATRAEEKSFAEADRADDPEAKRKREAADGASAGSGTSSAEDGTTSTASPDRLTKGKAQYRAGEYRSALQNLNPELNSDNRARRHEAMYLAAQCHAALGHSVRARKLLEDLVQEGAAQTAQAQRQLRSMEEADRSRRASRSGSR